MRKVKKLARRKGLLVRLEAKRGKGSHSTLFYGSSFTIVKDRKKEIGPGLLNNLLTDLDISRDEFE